MIIVIEDDTVLRLLQVTLDPQTAPERQAAFADYYSADGTDFNAWLIAQRSRLPQLFPATVRPVQTQGQLRAALRDADAVVLQDLEFGENELKAAPQLAIVQKFGTMERHIDVAACTKRGVKTATLRRRVNVACAEHAFGFMLALAKRICGLNGRMTLPALREAGYAPRMYDTRHAAQSNWGRVGGLRTLAGKTLGIVGMGEIGQELARRAVAFDMRIVYHQRSRAPEADKAFEARYAPLDDLLSSSDYVSLHLPLTSGTRGMIGAAELASCKRGSYLVNVSRADLVERSALMRALRHGPIAGAAFDMLYEEPAEPHDELLQFPNLLCTPHTAVAGRENGLADMADVLDNIARAIG
jgi:phosphoglycerate dehydrogenase-like enzyme